ncbi:MAG: bifunctional hydroxymethylpyrimidine kinase/phosphomethylpyrimidine kinase, partial [Akkermansiaceae bacterium]|nr:bifunctional hydroxymethylpyrimidine kinase/phosphomethylpyrimidine kinase [Akkermansiaceae bacterium]
HESEMESAARELETLFGAAVLLKGGHLDGAECVDLLVDGGVARSFRAQRIKVAGSHGTGCTLSAAITAALAVGVPLPRAVKIAKNFLSEALSESYEFTTAQGHTLHALNQGTFLSKNEA